MKNWQKHILIVVVQPADKFDEGLRAHNLGSRYPASASSAFEWQFGLVEHLAKEIRDQAVSEVQPSQRIPEILCGVNDGDHLVHPGQGLLGLLRTNFGNWIGTEERSCLDRSHRFWPRL
ncbi:MAG: hypothetical protein ACRD28_08830 [Acidobacteriaceae bacterium]